MVADLRPLAVRSIRRRIDSMYRAVAGRGAPVPTLGEAVHEASLCAMGEALRIVGSAYVALSSRRGLRRGLSAKARSSAGRICSASFRGSARLGDEGLTRPRCPSAGPGW